MALPLRPPPTTRDSRAKISSTIGLMSMNYRLDMALANALTAESGDLALARSFSLS